MSSVAPSSPNVFGFGAQVFGNVGVPTSESELKPTKADVRSDEDEGLSDTESDSGSEKSLLTAMASTTIDESPWKSAPFYRPLYLSTTSEYLPPLPKPKIPAGAQIIDSDEEGKGGKDISWASEGYENSLKVDNVFERFTKRVGYEGEQCVRYSLFSSTNFQLLNLIFPRYELRGTPLPFSSDKVFETLFPTPPAPPLPVTKAVFTVVPPLKRVYNTSAVPVCPVCKSKRVFECQLMPNLINVLRSPEEEKPKKLSDEERRKAVERGLKGEGKDERRGMEWGTCLIFSCEKDCCSDGDGWEDKECWREEKVLVQWDV
jgi:pre-rRNA-processing protein TSR4